MKKIVIIAAIFIILLSIVCCGVIFLGDIIEFSVNRFTDYQVSYSGFDIESVGKGRFNNIEVTLPVKDLTVSADSVEYGVSTKSIIKNEKVEGYCRMRGVSFLFGKEEASQEKSLENLFFMPFDCNRKYKEIFFSFYLSKNKIKIYDFKADSDDVRIGGKYEYYDTRDEIEVDITISFSPEITDQLEEGVRDNVLSEDEDGWYSTVIDYKGNPAFLFAIYKLTSK
ncbi:MAG: hypothetical protein P9L90_07520 [Candidatus Aadella gelida]|nr:hypothetical protein [Candidatus Aadella gelida]